MISDEEAKAIQAAGGVGEKALELVRDAGRFLGRIFGPAAEGLGQIGGDYVQYLRYRNWVAINERVERIEAQRTLRGAPRLIPPRIALPLLESASAETDPGLQEMWAALIANATDSSRAQEIPRVYIEILRSMEPIDALVLQTVYRLREQARRGEPPREITMQALLNEIDDSEERIKVSLSNLHRLECIDRYDTWDSIGTGFNIEDASARLFPTGLADRLLAACAP